MKHKIYLAITLTLILVFALPATALAKNSLDDKVVFGTSFTLEYGEVLDGDLVVIGGTALLEEQSRVNGDVVILGGTLQAKGTIVGEVVAFGGFIELDDPAEVYGNVTVLGARLDKEIGAEIGGNVVESTSEPFTFNIPASEHFERFNFGFSPAMNILWFIFRLLLWSAVAVLVVMFLPDHAERTASSAVKQPFIAGGLGLLTILIYPVFLIVLTITIIMIPLSLLGALLLAIAWIFGLISLGLEVGKRISKMVSKDWPPAVSAGVGTFFLMLVLNGVDDLVLCVGWMLPLVIGALGLGSVMLTRFGSQNYPTLVGAEVKSDTDLSSDDAEMDFNDQT